MCLIRYGLLGIPGYTSGVSGSMQNEQASLFLLYTSPDPISPYNARCKPTHAEVCLSAGPQLDLPHDVSPKQLETLLNGLLKQEEKLPYSFFVNDQQLSQELGVHLLQHKVRAH